MKLFKYVKILTLLLVAVLVTLSFNVVSYAYAESIFYFENSTVYGFLSEDVIPENVVIPSTIGGEPVTTIGASSSISGVSFVNANGKMKTLDLSQADNLTTISANSFVGCTLTGDLVVPSNVTKIGKSSFSSCDFGKVEILGNTPYEISGLAFKQGTKLVFNSSEVLDNFSSTYSTLKDKYDLEYKFTLKIKIDNNNIIEVGIYETGIALTDYDEIVATYLSDYDNVVLKQGDEVVNSSTILDGSELSFSGDEKSDVKYERKDITKAYKEKCEITAPIDGTYAWKFDNQVVSTEKTINIVKDAGTYEYVLEISVNGKLDSVITYNVVITAVDITPDWPVLTRYEYINVGKVNFVNDEIDDLIDLQFYKYDDTLQQYSTQPSTQFSIGKFKAVASVKDDLNYNIETGSFEFIVDYTYLNIVWESNEYNYIGSVIKPKYTLTGNKYGEEVDIDISDDSDEEARDVGDYVITIEGLNNKFFSLAKDTDMTFEWSIKTTELTIIWSNNQFQYNSTTKIPTAIGKNGNIEIPLVVSCNETIGEVGEYDLLASLPNEYSGFVLVGNTAGKCQVVATVLDITFDCLQTYYYNGQEIEIVPIINTVLNEDIQLITTGNKYKDVGEYICKVTGTNNPNYIVNDNVELSWEIKPKELNVNWKSLSYEYTGYYLRPNPSVSTGVPGETLKLNIDTDITINVNEDDNTGYVAIVSIDNPNYKLLNPRAEYFITRATARIENLNSEVSLVYTGENLLPEFIFRGDEGYLQIFVNGVRASGGVKDVGTYELKFYAPKSPNYKEMDEYLCIMTIKKATIETSVDNTTITVTNSESGFHDDSFVVVNEVSDYNDKTLTIAGNENYNVYKVLNVENIENHENNKLSFSVKDVNPSKLRIFVLEGDTLVEKQLTIEDDKVTFEGGNGTYFILMAKPKWIETTGGILTMVILLVVICALVASPLLLKNKKAKEEKYIQQEVNKRVTKKVEMGEEVTAEMANKIREEVINERSQNYKNDNKKADN